VPECIHGLEVPLCDACYPKAVVEKPKPARTLTPRSARVAGVNTTKKSINLTQQRVYHVTHINNLESILDAGAILSEVTPQVDLSTPLTRELRQSAEVAPGRSVADNVPFFLVPNASLWDDLRGGAQDETRWSAAARASVAADFVFLVTTVAALGDDAVVADGDAAATFTRFAAGVDRGRMIERLHDTEAGLGAEVLAPGTVPFDAIQLIGVANDRVRDRVRDFTATKVAVYPPWFQPAE